MAKNELHVECSKCSKIIVLNRPRYYKSFGETGESVIVSFGTQTLSYA